MATKKKSTKTATATVKKKKKVSAAKKTAAKKTAAKKTTVALRSKSKAAGTSNRKSNSKSTAAAATGQKTSKTKIKKPAVLSAKALSMAKAILRTPSTTAVAPSPLENEYRKPLSETQLRKVKTGLKKKDLEGYRDQLRARRASILGDMENLTEEARSDTDDHLSPEHMADSGTDSYEQEFTLGLVEAERKIVEQINEALIRLQRRTYGVCLELGVPIGRARLDAKPWAKYCIEVVREKERRGEL